MFSIYKKMRNKAGVAKRNIRNRLYGIKPVNFLFKVTSEGYRIGFEIVQAKCVGIYLSIEIKIPRLVVWHELVVMYGDRELAIIEERKRGNDEFQVINVIVCLLGTDRATTLSIHQRNPDNAISQPLAVLRGVKDFSLSGLIDSAFSPVQVCSLGRSGTTVLMEAMSKHPNIAMASSYPYEYRYSAYMARLYFTLLTPGSAYKNVKVSFTNSKHNDGVFYPNPYLQNSFR